MNSQVCHFCHRPAETPVTDNRFTACRACCKAKLIPFIAEALGSEELARQMGTICGRKGGPIPMMPSGLGAGEMSLVSAAKRIRKKAKAAGRGLYPAELSLSLAATRVAQTRRTASLAAQRQHQTAGTGGAKGRAKQAAAAMVARLGLGGRE